VADAVSPSSPRTLELHITGMDCADCALSLERGVARLDGVLTCAVNFSAGKMHVTGNVDPVAVEERIRALGYGVAQPAQVAAQVETPARHTLWGVVAFIRSRRDTVSALVGALLLAASVALNLLNLSEPWSVALHLATVALVGTPIMLKGWRSLLYSRNVTINLLMSIAAAGALIIGETGEAATVIVLFSIGEALEGYAAERARYSLQALLRLVPQQAITLRSCLDCAEHLGQDGYTGGPCPFCGVHEARIPVKDLRIGDVILVPPGERIPMDGIIRAGESAVNQAPITGESVPVSKQIDDAVFAGSINGAGALEVMVTQLANDNTLSRLVRLVEEAQAQRAPTQRFIDRFARLYTPGVVLVAVLLAVVPPLIFGAPFWNPSPEEHGWFYRALSLLIVACPCALVISTPVTIVSALSAAAQKGILIKGGAPLEALSGVRAFAFDKTGTLTEGRPTLTDVRAVDCLSPGNGRCAPCDDLLALAAAVERRSEHPLARAVVAAAQEGNLLGCYAPAVNVASMAGRGVRGQVNGKTVTLGNHALFDAEYPHPAPLCEQIARWEQQGQTAMLLSDGERVRGVLTVADPPRASSRAALTKLKALRPRPQTVMLTGDNRAVAEAVAQAVGVDDVRAELLPDQKLEAVRQLEADYGAVAMVGDGVNDAPALAAASVGIAMGGSGTAQAMEAADVVLMQDDLARLPDAVRLARHAVAVIRQNVTFSLAIKVLFLAFALPGWATLWLAVFADMGASLIVTANGMRLLRE